MIAFIFEEANFALSEHTTYLASVSFTQNDFIEKSDVGVVRSHGFAVVDEFAEHLCFCQYTHVVCLIMR